MIEPTTSPLTATVTGLYAGSDLPLGTLLAGRYRIDAVIYHVLLGGVYQPMIDGKPLGQAIDTCIPNADPKWVRLDTVDLTAGKHVLRFEGRDVPSPAARALVKQAYTLGIEKIVLLRLEDMAGYKEVQRRLQKK